MLRALAVTALAALALAGCGGRQASTPQAAAATPNLPCSLPYGTHVALVSPKPGSQAATNGPIVLVASRDLPQNDRTRRYRPSWRRHAGLHARTPDRAAGRRAARPSRIPSTTARRAPRSRRTGTTRSRWTM